jgi:hypothetical protein
MKQSVVGMVGILALGLLAGCTSPKVAYRSMATLKPAEEAGQYDVAFEITDVSDRANPRVLSTPRLRVMKGKEGSISVGDEKNGITCDAVVAASGKQRARTTVSIRQDGQVVWYASQTMQVSE